MPHGCGCIPNAERLGPKLKPPRAHCAGPDLVAGAVGERGMRNGGALSTSEKKLEALATLPGSEKQHAFSTTTEFGFRIYMQAGWPA